MKVEREKTDLRSSAPPKGSVTVGGPDTDWTTSPLVTEVLEQLPAQPTRFVARAPGRLDVMGGLAEYSGSLVLNMPIGNHVCVAVQRRTDGDLSIVSTRSIGLDGNTPFVIGLSQLYGPDESLIDPEHGRHLIPGNGAAMVRCVVGALVEMLRAGRASRLDGGLSVVVGSTLHELGGVGRDAAIVAAILTAAAATLGITLDPVEMAAVCQRVENYWLSVPVGIGDAVGVLLGKSNTLTELRCEPYAPAGSITLPDHLVLIGIDCGVVHPEAELKYTRVRTAAFMGQALINRIIQHDGAGRLQWDGILARISASDYVERFRDRIPTRLKGHEYLDRFGETGDPLTRIEPDFIYKIRSRTEHHIYEHARACQFVETLSRAIRNSDDRALKTAGDLMYASHWSYGQRCGLGSVETDLLVHLIREHGPDADIFGAKITGKGCGGVVAVLMRAGDLGAAALDAAIERYQSKTGRTATVVRGSIPGALVTGVRRM